MAQRRGRILPIVLSRFTRLLLVALNLATLVPVFLATVAPFVPPENWWPPALVALAFPYVIAIPAVWVVVWNWKRWRWAAFNLLWLLINLPRLDLVYATSGPKPPTAYDVRLVSYNVQAFGYDNGRIDSVIAHLKPLQPDILCVQEMVHGYGEPTTRPNALKRLGQQLGLKHHAFVELYPRGRFGLAIYSRYPIRDYGRVDPHTRSKTNGIMYADLALYGQQLRVYNVHLASYIFDDQLDRAANDLATLNTADSSQQLYQDVVKRLRKGWRIQVDQLKALEDEHAFWEGPTVVAGDFNNPPVSYVYRRGHLGLQDGHTASGRGRGTTYRLPGLRGLLNLRIDYSFFSHHLVPASSTPAPPGPSDHRALVNTFRFRFHDQGAAHGQPPQPAPAR